MYELIIFDADETLFDFRKSEREALKHTLLDCNIDYDESHHLKIYQEINTVIWKEFEEGKITQEKLKKERFIRLADALNLDINIDNMSISYLKHLADGDFLFDESMDLMEYLSAKYRLTMITNGLKMVQDKRIRQSDIAHHFEDIVVSEEVKMSKPDPKIFELAFNNINYKDKKKALIIGDSLSSDIKGGSNFGIDTCWYNPTKKLNTTDIQPTYEISCLTDLFKLL